MGVDVAENDTQETEQDTDETTGAGRLDAVAALDRAGAARLACLKLDGGGGRKKGESEGGECSDAGEHCR